MAAKVFISYRRDDAKWQAREIYGSLKRVLPPDHVFMDIDSIPPGVDFVEYLEGWVDQCDIMLALIGPGWADGIDPKTGRRRLENPDDFVRLEVRKGLSRGIPVVPIMLDGATIPDVGQLPDDLQRLMRRNAESIDHRTVETDVERLIRKLRLTDRPAETAPANPVVAPARVAPEGDRRRTEGRIEVDAKFIQGARGGWFRSGAGETRLSRSKSAVRHVRWGRIAAIAVGVLTIGYFGVNNFRIPAPWRVSPAGNQAEQAAKATQRAERRADEEAALTTVFSRTKIAALGTPAGEDNPACTATQKAKNIGDELRQKAIDAIGKATSSLGLGDDPFNTRRLNKSVCMDLCVVVPTGAKFKAKGAITPIEWQGDLPSGLPNTVNPGIWAAITGPAVEPTPRGDVVCYTFKNWSHDQERNIGLQVEF